MIGRAMIAPDKLTR